MGLSPGCGSDAPAGPRAPACSGRGVPRSWARPCSRTAGCLARLLPKPLCAARAVGVDLQRGRCPGLGPPRAPPAVRSPLSRVPAVASAPSGSAAATVPPVAERGGAPRGRAHGHGLLREHRASAPQPAPPARPSPRTVLNQGAHPAQARLAWRDSLPLQAQACPLSPSGRSALAGGTRRTGPRCPPRALPLGLPLTFQAVGAPACWRGSASRLMQDAGGAPDTSLQDADGSQLVPQRWPLDLGLSAVQAMKDGRMRSVLDRPPQPSDGTHGHPTGLPYWLLGSLTLTPCAPRGRDTSWF